MCSMGYTAYDLVLFPNILRCPFAKANSSGKQERAPRVSESMMLSI